MGASAVVCSGCRRTLADRYPDGRLRVHAFTAVDVHPHGEHGPFVRLFCECGGHRDYTVSARSCGTMGANNRIPVGRMGRRD